MNRARIEEFLIREVSVILMTTPLWLILLALLLPESYHTVAKLCLASGLTAIGAGLYMAMHPVSDETGSRREPERLESITDLSMVLTFLFILALPFVGLIREARIFLPYLLIAFAVISLPINTCSAEVLWDSLFRRFF